MEFHNHLAVINDTLNVLIQRFDAMEARQESSYARFKKLYRNFVDKCDMGSHPPFIKMASPISFEKSNQVVLKLQSFHEEKIHARERVNQFLSQFRQRFKPKTRPCLRPILKKFKKVHDHGDDDSTMFRSNSKFQESFRFFRSDLAKKNEQGFDLLDKKVEDSMIVSPVLDSDCMKSKIQACILGSAFLVSNVQKSNFTDHGYERVGSVKGRFKSPDFSISDGIVIDFLIHSDMGFILDSKQMLIPISGVGVRLGHNVFDELPHSTNNCVLQLGYHMPISNSGGTLITGHFTSKFQVKDGYDFIFLVCDGEFLKNDTTDLRDEIKLVVSNFCDKKNDESKIMVVGFVGFYQFMNPRPSILGNAGQKELVEMYGHHVFVGMQQTVKIVSLKPSFHEFILDKGGPTIQRLLDSKSTGKVETILVQENGSAQRFNALQPFGGFYNDAVVSVSFQFTYHNGIRDKGGTIFLSEFNSMDFLAICELSFVLNAKKRIFLEETNPLIVPVETTFLAFNLFDKMWFSSCSIVLNHDMRYWNGIQAKGGGSKFSKNDAEQRKLDVAFIGAQYILKLENGCSVSVANDMIIQVGDSNFYLRKLPMVVRRVICLLLLSICDNWIMGNKGRINNCKETECGEAKQLRFLYGQYHCSSFWEGVKKAGERLILQDGCINFFQKIVKSENLNANVHVLSYCWCGDLIRSSFSSGGLPELDMHANEFTFKESISTGDVAKKVEFLVDKVQPFKENLKN